MSPKLRNVGRLTMVLSHPRAKSHSVYTLCASSQHSHDGHDTHAPRRLPLRVQHRVRPECAEPWSPNQCTCCESPPLTAAARQYYARAQWLPRAGHPEPSRRLDQWQAGAGPSQGVCVLYFSHLASPLRNRCCNEAVDASTPLVKMLVTAEVFPCSL